MSTDPIQLISKKTGNWWQDDRRNWCAYCGVAVRVSTPRQIVPDTATRDHVIPRRHSGRHVTIPCCRACNNQKGSSGLPEFMLTDYFAAARETRRPNQWSLRDLWLVMALAAVEQAKQHAAAWPAAKPAPPARPAKPASGS